MHRPILTTGIILGLAAPALAASPSLQSGTASDGDVYIELSVPTRAIEGDAASACTLRVYVSAADTPFTAGDEIVIYVYEYDPLYFDPVVFKHTETVSGADASSGSVERTYDCAGSFDTDDDGEVEIYAEVTAEKDETSWYSTYDSAVTDSLPVTLEQDDGREPDDDSTGARTLGPTQAGLSRDADWFRFALAQTTDVIAAIEARPGDGRLDLRLRGQAGGLLAAGIDTAGGARLEFFALPAGTYFIEVAPRAAGDFNYYDLTAQLRGAGGCAAGSSEQGPCGRCGTQSRTCDALSSWSAYSACTGEGECEPDSVQSEPCGVCGTRPRTCSNDCRYVTGVCNDPCSDPMHDLGDECTGTCRGKLECATQGFPGGYCTLTCTSDESCGEHGVCGAVFGASRCLERCTGDGQCRDGYVCANVGGDSACVPRDASVEAAARRGTAATDRDPPESSERQGCAASRPPGWLAALLALGLGRRRRPDRG